MCRKHGENRANNGNSFSGIFFSHFTMLEAFHKFVAFLLFRDIHNRFSTILELFVD